MYLPEDPDILVSVINTRLRDYYDSLEDLCLSEDIDPAWLTSKLADSGYSYDEAANCFRRH